MDLESTISTNNNKLSKKEMIKDGMLSMIIPFYNIYLFNRAEKNLEYKRKLFQYTTNIFLAAAEIGFLASTYSYMINESNHLSTIGLIVGCLAKTKGVAWGSLREYEYKK